MISLEEMKDARSVIDLYDNIEILEDIFEYNEEHYMKISIDSKIVTSKYIPQESHWYIKFGNKSIDFYPAKNHCFSCTFQHQELNLNTKTDCPFLLGKLCLDKSVHIFNHVGFNYLPEKYSDIFAWYLERALAWIDAASKNLLVQNGDPFELPVIAFCGEECFLYKENGLDWGTFGYEYGFEHIALKEINHKNYLILKEIMDLDEEEYRGVIFWGDYFNNIDKISDKSIFVKLPKIPIIKPWMYPRTWEELFDVCLKFNVNLKKILAKTLAKSNMMSAGHLLCLCFPIPKTIGEQDEIYSWILIGLPNFAFPKNGFRRKLNVQINYYLNHFKGEIYYYRCENLDKRYLLSRGQMNIAITRKEVAIIGLGSLGSVTAEIMSRIGFENFKLFDGDKFEFSNVARHILNIKDKDNTKDEAVKNKIKNNNPSLKAKCYGYLENNNVERLNTSDIIIDCSANSKVLEILSSQKYHEQKFFVIAGFSYGAKDLIVFLQKGNNFNKSLFEQEVIPIYKALLKIQNVSEQNLVHQGIGCYHPVFPARFDDVNIWGNILVKVIEEKYEFNFTSSMIHFKINRLSIEVVNEWTK